MTEPALEISIAQWVEQLGWPQTRRAARHNLVAAKAIGALIECLRSTNESVVWAAVMSLGDMRAAEALEPLIELLERGTLEMDVRDTLVRITGRDLGFDPKKWRKAIRSLDAKPAAASRSTTPAECIARTADFLGVQPVGENGSYRFKLTLAGGRSQRVAVFFDRRDADGEELVVVYSECGPASPKYYEAVLRKNLSMPCGAFAVRDIDGTPNFVVVDAMPAATITPGALARKIEQIADRADQVEKQITNEDCR